MEFAYDNREKEINPKTIGISTATFYPEWSVVGNLNSSDKIRGDLALDTVKRALISGYQVSLVDGGSSRSFLRELESLGVDVEVQKDKGMSASRRQSIAKSSQTKGVEVISWIEPEKISLINSMSLMALPVANGEMDIVVPKRSEESFRSYPNYQAKYEKESNQIWNSVLISSGIAPQSTDLDVFFGPKIFKNSPEILELFMQKYKVIEGSGIGGFVNPESYSDAIFFPIVLALAKGYRVGGVDVDYNHPYSQTEFEKENPEFIKKRKQQRRDIIVGTINLVRLLHHDPKTKIIKTN